MKTFLFLSAEPVPLPDKDSKEPKPRLDMTSLLVAGASVSLITTVILGANEMLSKAAEAGIVQGINDWHWAMMPFVGAVFASIMSLLFKRDDWRENAARFIAAAVVGVGGPRIVTYIHPTLKEWSADPILLVLFGFGWGMIGFALAKWGFLWLNRRGPEVAEDEVEQMLKKRRKKLSDLTDPPSGIHKI